MNKKRNPFRKRNTPVPPLVAPRPASELSDAEIEEAIRQTRREILDAQHEELREREKARLTGDAPGSSPSKRSPLSEVFSKSKRRFK